jgi:hypothetical protein
MAGNKNSGRKKVAPEDQKQVHLGVRVTPVMYAKIKKAAKGEGRTIIGWIRRTLDQGLAAVKN